MALNSVKVKIERLDPDFDENPYFSEYEIPYEEGMNVLRALNFIYEELDSTIAFRGPCKITYCGTCTVRVNDKRVLACDRMVKKGEEIVIKPLDGHPRIRDLVIDFDRKA